MNSIGAMPGRKPFLQKKQSTLSIYHALFSLAFLCYNNGSETAVYMIPW